MGKSPVLKCLLFRNRNEFGEEGIAESDFMKMVMRAGITASCEILSGGCVCLVRGSSVTLQECRLPGVTSYTLSSRHTDECQLETRGACSGNAACERAYFLVRTQQIEVLSSPHVHQQ